MKKLKLEFVSDLKRGRFLDFVVSGRSLLKEFRHRGYDVAPRIPLASETRELLLLEKEADMPNGRVAIYVCPQCGDLGCGAVSVKIVREGADIIWDQFGWENDYDGEFWPFEKIGPFRFDEAEYRIAILKTPTSI